MNTSDLTNTPVKLLTLLGTTRQDRATEAAAKWLHKRADARDDIASDFFDVRSLVFDGNDEGQHIKEANAVWRDKVVSADGLMIVTPEYNHGYPGSLKLALDTLLPEYMHKAVGLVGTGGGFGGARVVENLTPVVRELGLVVSSVSLYFPKIRQAFDEEGNPADEAVLSRAEAFFDELVWLSRVLKWGRENLPNRFHQ